MDTGILKSVTHRLNMLGFATYVFFLWRFQRKMSSGTYPCGQIHKYIFFSFFFYHLLQLVLWRVLHCSRTLSPRFLLLKTSALQSHMRPEFPISDWIVNPCTLIYSEVKIRCEVGGFNCSVYTFWFRCATFLLCTLSAISESDRRCARDDGWKIHQFFCHIWSKYAIDGFIACTNVYLWDLDGGR